MNASSFEQLEGRQGTYALLLRIPKACRLRVGSLGLLRFASGLWVYVGSALGRGSTSLGHRLCRHFSRSGRRHWHIDYLLASAALPINAVWLESPARLECALAEALRERPDFQPGPAGFGATDCRGHCQTHLLRYVGPGGIRGVKFRVQLALSRLELEPED
ncbi:MAG: GIY-YIG nuclease family protein [Deltaproteobacteria bacterium]|nr:GIY-YIG nuclease family protein [Deltaproteobacteria bacterium]